MPCFSASSAAGRRWVRKRERTSARKSRERNASGAREEQPNVEVSSEVPRVQKRGRDRSGGNVNAPATNFAYSPSFVMRGFAAAVTVFDGPRTSISP